MTRRSGFDPKDLDRARRILRTLPANVRAELDAALDKGAAEIEMRAKALAPVGDPEGGNLRDAIETRTSLDGFTPRGALAKLFSRRSGAEAGLSRFVGVFPRKRGDAGWYAAWVEFGTSQRFTKQGASRGVMPARPFLRPAFFGAARSVRARIGRAIGKASRAAVGGLR